jgi:hypothetical protein
LVLVEASPKPPEPAAPVPSVTVPTKVPSAVWLAV